LYFPKHKDYIITFYQLLAKSVTSFLTSFSQWHIKQP